MTEWMSGKELERRQANGNLGGTMRLGAYEAVLAKGSKVAEIYGTTHISERHRHRYEVNTRYRNILEAAGLRFSGLSPDGLLPEIVERPDHPWFIGVQFHPELKSRPFEPHPLFASFIGAAVEQSRLVNCVDAIMSNSVLDGWMRLRPGEISGEGRALSRRRLSLPDMPEGARSTLQFLRRVSDRVGNGQRRRAGFQ